MAWRKAKKRKGEGRRKEAHRMKMQQKEDTKKKVKRMG